MLEYPDPRLRIRARAVSVFDPSLKQLVEDMFETMYAARAIGLAASQVNVPLQVITLDVSDAADSPQVFINPVLLSRDTPGIVEESCLSVPGVVDRVPRATRVRVRTRDLAGGTGEQDLQGLQAVCLQHEMDHLEGKLFVDYLSWLRRFRIRREITRSRRMASATEARC